MNQVSSPTSLSTYALTSHDLRTILRQDFVSFTERAFYELNPQARLQLAGYIEAIATKLEACRRGEIKRLIINLPPRYLKSHCVTVSFPAWLLGHHPACQIIAASYGQDLSEKFARDCRTVMNSSWYKTLFKTRIADDRSAVNDFMTTDMGFRMATSVGGVLTGRGADFIIIDDPLKPDEALSETRRKAVNEWYENTLLSRLNNKANGCIIIVMQRLHQNDLAGHVLEQGGWEVLSFPAIAEQDEQFLLSSPLGSSTYVRRVGDALHPERESLDDLARIRRTIGEYNFQSQYQQDPTPPGGAMVKTEWLKHYDVLPKYFDHIVQSWDTANKVTDLSDPSVCVTIGEKDGKYYVLDVFCQKMDFPALKKAVLEQDRQFNPDTILIEDKASGTQLIQELQNDGMGKVKGANPSGTDKIMRLHAQTALIENGFLLLPLEAYWLADYVKELTSFPGCKHDDQVDATTQALQWLKQPRGMSPKDWARAMGMDDETIERLSQ